MLWKFFLSGEYYYEHFPIYTSVHENETTLYLCLSDNKVMRVSNVKQKSHQKKVSYCSFVEDGVVLRVGDTLCECCCDGGHCVFHPDPAMTQRQKNCHLTRLTNQATNKQTNQATKYVRVKKTLLNCIPFHFLKLSVIIKHKSVISHSTHLCDLA